METLVAIAILTTALITLAQLFTIAITTNRSARVTTFSAVLAQQKMEQLRSLAWGYDLLGLPVSDTATNTAVFPEQSNGGTGLSPSPAGTLDANVAGYVDYLDEYGRSLGGGSSVAPGTVYIRRWSIDPLPTNPNNTLIIQVSVTKVVPGAAGGGAAGPQGGRMRDEARIVSVKTRKST